MNLTRRQLTLGVVAFVVVALIATPVLGAILSGLSVSGDVPIRSNDGPSVTVGGADEIALEGTTPFVSDTKLLIATTDGNSTFSSPVRTSLTVQSTHLTGSYTNLTDVDVTNGTLTADPEDKVKLGVSGDATSVDWRDYAADDGTTDIVIDGAGTATLELYNLPASSTLYLHDVGEDKHEAKFSTDSNGQATVTVDIQSGTIYDAFTNGDIRQNFADSDRHLQIVSQPKTTGDITYLPDGGPTVDLESGTTANLAEPFPFTDTINMTTDAGDMEIVGNGGTATLAPTNITGTQSSVTNIDATSDTLLFDPADKSKVFVNGNVNTLEWRDTTPDDGTADAILYASSGETELTVAGVAADSTFTAVNPNEKPYDLAESTSLGEVSFDIPHSTSAVLVQSGNTTSDPVQSNPNPTGDLTSTPSQLSIEINDADFGETEEVNVTLLYDGTQIHNENITSNQTVSASIPGTPDTGGHTWTATAEDAFGNVNSTQYAFNIPSTVYIYNETKPASNQYQLINNTPTDVKVVFTGSGETVLSRTVSDGIVDLSGINPDESYVLTINAENYFVRSIYVNNIYEQNSVFILNQSQSNTDNTVVVDDQTGRFSDNPVLKTQRVINTSNVSKMADNGYEWLTISGDRLGADSQYIDRLSLNKRYRFVALNKRGDRRVLGEYTAKRDGLITLEIGEVTFSADQEQGVAFDGTAERRTINETSGDTARFLELVAWAGEVNTTDIQFKVTRADNTSKVVVPQTTESLGDRQTVFNYNLTDLDPSAPQDQGYKVTYTFLVDDGDDVSGTRFVGTLAPFGFGMDPGILNLIGWVALVAFAGFTALKSPKLSVMGTPVMAAGLTMFDITHIPTVLLAIAGAIGVFYLVGESRRR